MERIKSDKRFKHVLSDPRFRKMPKHERKVQIDKRFKDMFSDDQFKVKYSMDKRGRKIKHTTNEDLKNYYELSSSDSNSSDDEEDKEEVEKEVEEKTVKTKDKTVSKRKEKLPKNKSKEIEKIDKQNSKKKNLTEVKLESSDSSDDEEQSDSESEMSEKGSSDSNVEGHIDLARGEGNVESSDAGDTTSESSDDEDDEFNHPWGELDNEAPETNEITRRLAICNMDWDRIKAVDVFVLLNSFKSADSIIHSVKIYPSEYGKARMKEEDVTGPQELVEKKLSDDEKEDDDEAEYHMEKLRSYQLNRLRYYYAVVECDTPETANKIYEECNGLEYESSAVRLDLRFIPDSMTFDDKPTSIADSMPAPGTYNPSLFTTSALQQAKVDLTWDETDPDRVKATHKAFSQKDIDKIDLKAYLASSADEDEFDGKTIVKGVDGEDAKGEEDAISKYRALLLSIEETEKKKKDRDVEMEITWTPGLKNETEEMVEKKISQEKDITPWDQYLQKRKNKKKEKRELKKSQNEDGEISDDDLPSDVDLDDPFFKQELGEEYVSKGKNKKDKRKKGKQEKDSNETNENKAELELLFMEPDDGKQHFNLKSLILDDKNKKKRKREDSTKTTDQSNFELNTKDERFEALYTSHLYNIDPSDPQFKKTKGMLAIVDEKQKRRENKNYEEETKLISNEEPKKDYEVTSLVRSLKSKAHVFGKKRNRK